jgi:hypothetical protein
VSITTYAELQTAVKNWLHRSGVLAQDDVTSIIPDLITIAEKRIFREVRVRVMESTLSSTIANGVIAVPADYLDLKFAYINATPTSALQRAPASQVYSTYPTRSAQGKPTMIAREGSNFIFGPYPDSGYTVSGIYYAKPTGIATSANTLFTDNPDLYLFAALCEAAPYIQDDPRVQLWEAKYASIKQQMAFEDESEYGSGGGLNVSAA